MTERKKTREVKIGGVRIGAENRIAVQSMLNARADDPTGNAEQAKALEAAGCDIIRIAIPNTAALSSLSAVKAAVAIPLVADIHFDYRLALASVDAGADKIRINPGNIGDETKIKAVADACAAAKIPIRVGVNSGSVEKELLVKYGNTPQALAESALKNVAALEKCGFYNIVISVKSSDPAFTVRANRIISDRCDYPLHIGVTEAGTERLGKARSFAAIGSLLLDGIGDTIRVSLTGDPVREVAAGRELLDSLGISGGATLISCPTCGRTRGPVAETAERVDRLITTLGKPVKVAVMGCEVNGPGEAREADFGIAFGDNCAVLFKKGVIVAKTSPREIYNLLEKTLKEYCDGTKNI